MDWKLAKCFTRMHKTLNKYYGIESVLIFRGVSNPITVLTEIDIFEEKIDHNNVVREEQLRKIEVLCEDKNNVYEILKPFLLAGERGMTSSIGAFAKQKNEYAFLLVPNKDNMYINKYRVQYGKEMDTSTSKIALFCTLIEKQPRE